MVQFSPIFLIFCAAIATLVFYEFRRNDTENFDAEIDSTPEHTGTDSRLDAKQTNERIRISATYANNISVGLLIGGLVGPSVRGEYPNPLWYYSLVIVALCLHLGARNLAGSLRSED